MPANSPVFGFFGAVTALTGNATRSFPVDTNSALAVDGVCARLGGAYAPTAMAYSTKDKGTKRLQSRRGLSIGSPPYFHRKEQCRSNLVIRCQCFMMLYPCNPRVTPVF